MKRLSLALMTMSAFGGAGCASSAPPAQPAKAAWKPMTTLMVDYEVSEPGASPKVLLAGRTEVGDRWTSALHLEGAHDKEDLELVAEPMSAADVFVVGVRYKRRNDSDLMAWTPLVLAKRGEKATAETSWSGGSRAVSITVR